MRAAIAGARDGSTGASGKAKMRAEAAGASDGVTGAGGGAACAMTNETHRSTNANVLDYKIAGKLVFHRPEHVFCRA